MDVEELLSSESCSDSLSNNFSAHTDDDDDDIICNYLNAQQASIKKSVSPLSADLVAVIDTYDDTPVSITFDSTQDESDIIILEENNSNSGINLNSTQSFQRQLKLTAVPQNNTHETDFVGCLRSLTPNGSNNLQDSASNDFDKKIREEVLQICNLLPTFNYESVYKVLHKNRNAKNRIELSLWDLLPNKRPRVKHFEDLSTQAKRLKQSDTRINNMAQPVSNGTLNSQTACSSNGSRNRETVFQANCENRVPEYSVEDGKVSSTTGGGILRPAKLVINDKWSCLDDIASRNSFIMAPSKLTSVPAKRLMSGKATKSSASVEKHENNKLTNQNVFVFNSIKNKYSRQIFHKYMEYFKHMENIKKQKLTGECNNFDFEKRNITRDIFLKTDWLTNIDTQETSNNVAKPSTSGVNFSVSEEKPVCGGTSKMKNKRKENLIRNKPVVTNIALPFKFLQMNERLVFMFPQADKISIRQICKNLSKLENIVSMERLQTLAEHTLVALINFANLFVNIKACTTSADTPVTAITDSNTSLHQVVPTNTTTPKQQSLTFDLCRPSTSTAVYSAPETNEVIGGARRKQIIKKKEDSKSDKDVPTNTKILTQQSLWKTRWLKTVEMVEREKRKQAIEKEDSKSNKNVPTNTTTLRQQSLINKFDLRPSTSIAVYSATNKVIGGARKKQIIEKEGSESNKNAKKKNIVLPLKFEEMYETLVLMFPQMDKDFIRQTCKNVSKVEGVCSFEQLQTLAEHTLQNKEIQSAEIDVRSLCPEKDENNQYIYLLGIFPDADPTYLKKVVARTQDNPSEIINFIQSQWEKPTYPTKEEKLRKKTITQQQIQYTSKFDVKQFLEIFPDPLSHFTNPKRTCKSSSDAVEFLKSHFTHFEESYLKDVYKWSNYNLTLTVQKLENTTPYIKLTRNIRSLDKCLTLDIPLLQEFAFITHRQEIVEHLDILKETEMLKFAELKAKNELLECQCCYDNECMPSKCSTCDDGHIFCNSCILKGTESQLSQGETRISCFSNCDGEFTIPTLQKILPPTQFSIFIRKKQEAEVMAAKVEGLVSCPFCHFASVPPPEDKVFKCLNPECMKESCRLCKQPNHIPLRCYEEKSDQARLFLEEKMTEALVRKCYKCSRPYFKDDGCNKITCSCGAMMCYICDIPIYSYDHFGTGRCPQWSDNLIINNETVRAVAEKTVELIKKKDPNVTVNADDLLKYLPSTSNGAIRGRVEKIVTFDK
uniref:uncharacterized protein LOC117602303 n=1 Tax=Osmia lignaria TaxID=473952 RepID=UPI0014787206|nr:uncharacterized protein LOC117602303 [Osmia lignaria]XP_034176037.1 uncharacterized protein LOC117602303 [Osmia lignaria]XP_034176047.1 uncharacterized protein LOC117602303 [Osmia lignaria]